MGYSRWDTLESKALYASTTATRSTLSTREIFTSNRMPAELDPSKIILRESRDSDLNPASTPVIIGLDVTGSMGIIAEKMARGHLGKLMSGLFETRPISDPHVMIMGIGDANCDDAPLQVSQFEADIKIDESLSKLYLEGGGGGNHYESYDLAWYFAATRTSVDSVEKRGKKGYIFTIGDEMPPPSSGYSASQLDRVFGNNQLSNMTSTEALAAAQEKYDVFHVIVEQGNYAARDPKRVVSAWSEKLGKRAIALRNWEHVAEVISAAIRISEGEDVDQVIESFTKPVQETMRHAFK